MCRPPPRSVTAYSGQQLQPGLLAGHARGDELQYSALDHQRERLHFACHQRDGAGLRQRPGRTRPISTAPRSTARPTIMSSNRSTRPAYGANSTQSAGSGAVVRREHERACRAHRGDRHPGQRPGRLELDGPAGANYYTVQRSTLVSNGGGVLQHPQHHHAQQQCHGYDLHRHHARPTAAPTRMPSPPPMRAAPAELRPPPWLYLSPPAPTAAPAGPHRRHDGHICRRRSLVGGFRRGRVCH
jgi:hypothetical protein